MHLPGTMILRRRLPSASEIRSEVLLGFKLLLDSSFKFALADKTQDLSLSEHPERMMHQQCSHLQVNATLTPAGRLGPVVWMQRASGTAPVIHVLPP